MTPDVRGEFAREVAEVLGEHYNDPLLGWKCTCGEDFRDRLDFARPESVGSQFRTLFVAHQNDALMPLIEAAWVITDLALMLPFPPPENEPHPERTPAGPFLSREAADEWASALTGRYGGGSWTVAPLHRADAITSDATTEEAE